MDISEGTIAKCNLSMSQSLCDSATPFEKVLSAINRVRTAIDERHVTFHDPKRHPPSYQLIGWELGAVAAKPLSDEIEYFLAGKTYWLGFRAVESPGEVWISDPWDAAYLGVTQKVLSQSAYVLQARGIIDLDKTLSYARPSGKLLTQGWPTAMDSIAIVAEKKKLSLSGLPRKEKLLADVKTSLEHGIDSAILVIDLDNFKSVNDSYGSHQEGDACLERVVQTLGTVVGKKGMLYRWGGDEFAIHMTEFSTEEAAATAERIRRAIEESAPGRDIRVTTSIGVSGSDRMRKATDQELLDAADHAMYASKTQREESCHFVADQRPIANNFD